jgi:hypothetical protein
MNMKKIRILLPAFAALVMLLSCDTSAGGGSGNVDSWGKVQTKTFQVDTEAGESVYLVKVYQGSPNDKTVPAKYTGGVKSRGDSAARNAVSGSPSPDGPAFVHHRRAVEFNALPPLAVPEQRGRRAASPSASTWTDGPSASVWVEDAGGRFVQKTATLRKTGTHCKIWVINENFGSGDNQITQARANELADKFDAIYDLETFFFGYEYGGGPGGDGGIDGDLKIQILVYDIDFDANINSQEGKVLGYFWDKDEYSQAVLDMSPYRLKSNMAEIFYLDAYYTNKEPQTIYATLIHEFQHMIHYNQKIRALNRASETWYNEMLSMLAEDMISPLVGIDPKSHPKQLRMPYFNAYYWKRGVTEWTDDYLLVSYANTYAFGAYLVRNYGGVELLHEMARNSSLNLDSVDAALRTLSGGDIDFYAALKKFPEVLLNSKNVPGNYANGVLLGGKTASYNHSAQGLPSWNSPALGRVVNLSDYRFDGFDINSDIKVTPIGGGEQTYPPQIHSSVAGDMGPNSIDVLNLGLEPKEVTISYYSKAPVQFYLLGKKSNGVVETK